MIPQFRSVLRSVTSGHEAKDLYSAAARLSMTTSLRNELRNLLYERGLVVETTPLKSLTFPESLQAAIQVFFFFFLLPNSLHLIIWQSRDRGGSDKCKFLISFFSFFLF